MEILGEIRSGESNMPTVIYTRQPAHYIIFAGLIVVKTWVKRWIIYSSNSVYFNGIIHYL
jgi:hypothetical protein